MNLKTGNNMHDAFTNNLHNTIGELVDWRP